MDQYTKLPLAVTWYVTRKCNLFCEHCYFIHNKKPEKFLNRHEYIEITEQIKQLKPFSVNLIGGEVFLVPDIMEIIQTIKKNGHKINIATNGLLLNDIKIKKLKELNIGNIQISIDGSNNKENDPIRGQGTFDKIIKTTNELIDYGLNVSWAYLLCERNINDYLSIIDLGNKMGVRQLNMNVFIPPSNFSDVNKYELGKVKLKNIFDDIDKYINNDNIKIEVKIPCFANFKAAQSSMKDGSNLTSHACEAGKRSFVILPNGDVVACEMLEHEIEGNLFETELNEIWQNENSFFKWRNNQKIKGKCSTCYIFDYCKGGCRASAYLRTNDFYSEEPLCWI